MPLRRQRPPSGGAGRRGQPYARGPAAPSHSMGAIMETGGGLAAPRCCLSRPRVAPLPAPVPQASLPMKAHAAPKTCARFTSPARPRARQCNRPPLAPRYFGRLGGQGVTRFLGDGVAGQGLTPSPTPSSEDVSVDLRLANRLRAHPGSGDRPRGPHHPAETPSHPFLTRGCPAGFPPCHPLRSVAAPGRALPADPLADSQLSSFK